MATKKATLASKTKETPSVDDISLAPSRAGLGSTRKSTGQKTPPVAVLAPPQVGENLAREQIPPVVAPSPSTVDSEQFVYSDRITQLDDDVISHFQSEPVKGTNNGMQIVVNAKDAVTLTNLTDHNMLHKFRNFVLHQDDSFDSRRYIKSDLLANIPLLFSLQECEARWPTMDHQRWFASNIPHSQIWDWYVTKVTRGVAPKLAEHLQLTIEKIVLSVRDVSAEMHKVSQYVILVNEAITTHVQNAGQRFDHLQCVKAVVNMLKAQRSSSPIMEYIHQQVLELVAGYTKPNDDVLDINFNVFLDKMVNVIAKVARQQKSAMDNFGLIVAPAPAKHAPSTGSTHSGPAGGANKRPSQAPKSSPNTASTVSGSTTCKGCGKAGKHTAENCMMSSLSDWNSSNAEWKDSASGKAYASLRPPHPVLQLHVRADGTPRPQAEIDAYKLKTSQAYSNNRGSAPSNASQKFKKARG